MKINVLWSFGEAVENIKAIKEYYIDLLSSFSIYEGKQKNIAQGEIKRQIYSLGILEWQKDKLWEFMNDDVPYAMLVHLGNRQKPN